MDATASFARRRLPSLLRALLDPAPLPVTRPMLATLLILTAMIGVLGLSSSSASAAIPANFFTVSDSQGANDEPGQKDLTQFGRDDTDPLSYKIFWSWDEIDQWSGAGQTGDACALFDTDGDSFINFVVCGRSTTRPRVRS